MIRFVLGLTVGIAAVAIATDDPKPGRLSTRLTNLEERVRRIEESGHPRTNVIQAQRFELIDKKGKLLGVWATGDDGIIAFSMNPGGSPYAGIAVYPGKSGFIAMGSNTNNQMVQLLVDETPKVVGLSLRGPYGSNARAIFSLSDQIPFIATLTKDGDVIWSAPTSE